MRRRIVIVVLAAALVAAVTPGFSQQPARSSTPTVAKSALPDSAPPAPAVTRRSAAKGINADLAYKANCSRCHAAPHKFSERAMATIMRHMRVRANLTEEETKAILHYLTE